VIRITASDVAVAALASKPSRRTRSGTTTIPPPTPKRALRKPDAMPMPASERSVRFPVGTAVS
jgi:hypothetical protein